MIGIEALQAKAATKKREGGAEARKILASAGLDKQKRNGGFILKDVLSYAAQMAELARGRVETDLELRSKGHQGRFLIVSGRRLARGWRLAYSVAGLQWGPDQKHAGEHPGFALSENGLVYLVKQRTEVITRSHGVEARTIGVPHEGSLLTPLSEPGLVNLDLQPVSVERLASELDYRLGHFAIKLDTILQSEVTAEAGGASTDSLLQ